MRNEEWRNRKSSCSLYVFISNSSFPVLHCFLRGSINPAIQLISPVFPVSPVVLSLSRLQAFFPNGFEFLRELRQLPALVDVPVIVVTAKELTAEDVRILTGQT